MNINSSIIFHKYVWGQKLLSALSLMAQQRFVLAISGLPLVADCWPTNQRKALRLLRHFGDAAAISAPIETQRNIWVDWVL
jgi:hypothetical protein